MSDKAGLCALQDKLLQEREKLRQEKAARRPAEEEKAQEFLTDMGRDFSGNPFANERVLEAREKQFCV